MFAMIWRWDGFEDVLQEHLGRCRDGMRQATEAFAALWPFFALTCLVNQQQNSLRSTIQLKKF
jgi:hypothetical protein